VKKYPSTWGSHPKKLAIKWEKQILKYFIKHLLLFNKSQSTWRTHTKKLGITGVKQILKYSTKHLILINV